MRCIDCNAPAVVLDDGLEAYGCKNGHINNRMIDHSSAHYDDSGEIVHRSVGALLTHDNRILLLRRKKYPFAYTIPAGHLEDGEQPSGAVRREVQEETGITITDATTIFQGVIDDRCRRGADRHHWNLYTAALDERPAIDTNDEASDHVWTTSPDQFDLTEATATLLSRIQ